MGRLFLFPSQLLDSNMIRSNTTIHILGIITLSICRWAVLVAIFLSVVIGLVFHSRKVNRALM